MFLPINLRQYAVRVLRNVFVRQHLPLATLLLFSLAAGVGLFSLSRLDALLLDGSSVLVLSALLLLQTFGGGGVVGRVLILDPASQSRSVQ